MVEVKRVLDRVIGVKLKIEGVMMNVVIGVCQVGCVVENKEKFWRKFNEVIESIPKEEKVIITGAEFNGHLE